MRYGEIEEEMELRMKCGCLIISSEQKMKQSGGEFGELVNSGEWYA